MIAVIKGDISIQEAETKKMVNTIEKTLSKMGKVGQNGSCLWVIFSR